MEEEALADFPSEPDLKACLVDKSFEAYALALETINRITVQYRLEAFCYLLCNAWELLLKAKILDNKGELEAIYSKRRKNRPRRTLSLRECLGRVMPNETDPVRCNIARVGELRDESVHLVIDQIPRDVIALFQASAINYHNCASSWFGMSLADRLPAGMMSIVYDVSPEDADLTSARLRSELGKDTADFLSRYCSEIREEWDRLNRPIEFSIGIDYHLVLTKRQDRADIRLSSGPSGENEVRIVDRPRDPALSHPFRQKEVIKELKKRIPKAGANQFDIQCVNVVYGIKSKSDYYYQGKVQGSPGQYSQEFVDLLIDQYKKDEKFFTKVRQRRKLTDN